ncbi:MAG: hypothetical protein KAU20_01755 [Nanoarchaeota archaeon]|nr:hypothetical protein [Nanoarchaeota archaeon]
MKSILLLFVSIGLMISVGCKKQQLQDYDHGAAIYSAISNQSGEAAPVVSILENSIGDIQWVYVSEGVYHAELPGGFPLGKTFLLCNNGVDGYISADLRHWAPGFIELRTFAGYDVAGNPAPADGCSGINFEIRVYN